MNLDLAITHLNDPQREAVLHLGSPLLILAGPGSGKTRVITIKIAWLIKECNINPRTILAMTFTNKAAKEMKERIHTLLYDSNNTTTNSHAHPPFISTFHSFGAYILRRFCTEADLKKDFQIYDESDQLALLQEANPHLEKKWLKPTLSSIARAKDYGLSPYASTDQIEEFVHDIEVYENYEALKKKTGNIDFGDLLLKPYTLITQHEHILQSIINTWKWFFVDEYQDTNTIQGRLLYQLCHHTANISAVGDDDQSIYRFRGAVLENILQFEESFPHTKIIRLNQNYRSTPQIINLANQLISHNAQRHGKTIFSELTEREKPKLCFFYDNKEEEQHIVSLAKRVLSTNNNLAILYRVNSQSRGYEMALREAGLAYSLVGSVGFFDRAEIKDAVAYLRLYKNPYDIVSFSRIANKPARGLGKKTMDTIKEYMSQGMSWIEVARQYGNNFQKKAMQGLQALEQLLLQSQSNTQEHDSQDVLEKVGGILKSLLMTSGIWSLYEEEEHKLENLEEFISYAMKFSDTEEDWLAFFEQISLNEKDEQETNDGSNIQLMTLHRSKGLEFDHVIICGLEEGLMPMVDVFEVSLDDIEEERRLLYVGITRAKQYLSLTYCHNRERYGRYESTSPSIFLNELDTNEMVEHEKSTSHGSIDGYGEWKIGDEVRHTSYGKGYVRNIRKRNHLIIQVEFNSGYEATFIPKFTQELEKVT